jgi:hypothetical protein
MFRWYQNTEKCYIYLLDISANEGNKNNNEDIIGAAYNSNLLGSYWFT